MRAGGRSFQNDHTREPAHWLEFLPSRCRCHREPHLSVSLVILTEYRGSRGEDTALL